MPENEEVPKGRRAVYGAVLVRPAWLLGLTVYGLFDAIRSDLVPPEAQANLVLRYLFPGFPVWVWVMGFSVFVLAVSLEGTYRVVQAVNRQLLTLSGRLRPQFKFVTAFKGARVRSYRHWSGHDVVRIAVVNEGIDTIDDVYIEISNIRPRPIHHSFPIRLSANGNIPPPTSLSHGTKLVVDVFETGKTRITVMQPRDDSHRHYYTDDISPPEGKPWIFEITAIGRDTAPLKQEFELVRDDEGYFKLGNLSLDKPKNLT